MPVQLTMMLVASESPQQKLRRAVCPEQVKVPLGFLVSWETARVARELIIVAIFILMVGNGSGFEDVLERLAFGMGLVVLNSEASD